MERVGGVRNIKPLGGMSVIWWPQLFFVLTHSSFLENKMFFLIVMFRFDLRVTVCHVILKLMIFLFTLKR